MILGEQAHAQRAEDTADQMDRSGTHRVINLDFVEEEHGNDHQEAGH